MPLVSQKHKAVILNVRDPNRILTLLPKAKPLEYKGRTLVAVPHRLDETRVLNNLQIRVPSPIRFYYEWSGKYKPFDAQRHTAEFLTLHPRAFVLNELGTGKTLAMLWAAEFLREQGIIHRVLVVSPLSTLRTVWVEEVKGSFLQRSVAVLHGSAAKRKKLLAQPHDYYVINHDGVQVVRKELMVRKDIDLIIIDEAASFRNAQTDRWKALNDVITSRTWVWGATGTPTPNAPTDAWGLAKPINAALVPKRFTHFRDMTMQQHSTYRWAPRPEALEIVHKVLQPSIRFTREECVDIPDVTYISKEVTLTPEQVQAYRELLKQYYTEFAGGQITAVNEGVKRNKMLQMLCGAVYPDEGGVIHIPCQPRLQVVAECIEEASSKVIVFAPLIGVLGLLREFLSSRWETALVHGDTPPGDRDKIFHAFQHTDSPHVLVAHPQCMAHGLTLTRAAVIVWFGPTSPELYTQANGRITRPGQTRQQIIIHIESSALERETYRRLREKVSLQGVLLDMLKETGRKAQID